MFNHQWRSAFSVYAHPRVLSMVFIGFAAGLPFNLIASTLAAWQADIHVDPAMIGYFSAVGVAYSVKVLWSPLVDQMRLPFLHRWLGKRRSWMLVSQLGIAAGLLLMSRLDMHTQLPLMALVAVMVAVCSATQDIAIDAYRIEVVAVEFQGAMAAMYLLGYRLALLMAGAGVLYLAEWIDWSIAYQLMAVAMGLCLIVTIMVPEPVAVQGEVVSVDKKAKINVLSWFQNAVIGPFADFFERNGSKGLLILTLIVVYKLSDITMGVMANPFYFNLGFSKSEIAEVTKLYGFVMTIVGTSVGGVLVMRLGMWRPLLLGAVLVMVTNLVFAALAYVKPNLWLLAAVVSADNLSGGIAAAVFIAYLSSLTNTAYTATQYALFSSLMTLPAKLIGAGSGLIVSSYGYGAFFIYAGVLGLPAVVVVMVLMRLDSARSQNIVVN